MDGAVFHGYHTGGIYNAGKFEERRYTTIGIDGYNRRLAGELEWTNNIYPRPYGPSVDDWVDERDRVPKERRVKDDYRHPRFFAKPTTSAAVEECRPASGVVQQARRLDNASASPLFAASAVRRGIRSCVPSNLPPSVAVGHRLAGPLASEYIQNSCLLVNRPASTFVTLGSRVTAGHALSDIASGADATNRPRNVKGKHEKDDMTQRGQHNAGGLVARIKANIRNYIDAKLRRYPASRT
ncbi:probable xsa-associated protein [Xanthomonas albilineans GPE PC73]|uniref:Probable xsa-associated protein n=1 Tax=Xanthomonas albilineans (strain GPE PC73 / CFBP 7063) TaxID=380358 RepID=D2UAJ3_XANAP|nr:probable xsa-associated protein [Xanthomonas albilineans GPE PC73]